MKNFIQSEETIQKNLYLDGDWNYYWQEWKHEIIPTIRKYEKLLHSQDWGYCLESDLQQEIDFLSEIDKEIEIIANENGLIIYKVKGE